MRTDVPGRGRARLCENEGADPDAHPAADPPPTKLTVGDSIGQQPTSIVPLSGTTKGAAVSGLALVQKLGNDPLCVRLFQVTPR